MTVACCENASNDSNAAPLSSCKYFRMVQQLPLLLFDGKGTERDTSRENALPLQRCTRKGNCRRKEIYGKSPSMTVQSSCLSKKPYIGIGSTVRAFGSHKSTRRMCSLSGFYDLSQASHERLAWCAEAVVINNNDCKKHRLVHPLANRPYSHHD